MSDNIDDPITHAQLVELQQRIARKIAELQRELADLHAQRQEDRAARPYRGSAERDDHE